MVVVKKKDGTVRVCFDARELNKWMVSECDTPMPPDVQLHRFRDMRVMSSIDLRQSYWQISLTEDSKPFTAFLYEDRSYTYQDLPFGLKTAVASFGRCMDLVLGLEVREYAVNYVDDLLVASNDNEVTSSI